MAPPMGPAAPDITERLVPLAGGPRVPSMDPRYPNNPIGIPARPDGPQPAQNLLFIMAFYRLNREVPGVPEDEARPHEGTMLSRCVVHPAFIMWCTSEGRRAAPHDCGAILIMVGTPFLRVEKEICRVCGQPLSYVERRRRGGPAVYERSSFSSRGKRSENPVFDALDASAQRPAWTQLARAPSMPAHPGLRPYASNVNSGRPRSDPVRAGGAPQRRRKVSEGVRQLALRPLGSSQEEQ